MKGTRYAVRMRPTQNDRGRRRRAAAHRLAPLMWVWLWLLIAAGVADARLPKSAEEAPGAAQAQEEPAAAQTPGDLTQSVQSEPSPGRAQYATPAQRFEQRTRGPKSFSAAKKAALKQVYFDHQETFYCRVPYEVVREGGKERTVLRPSPERYLPRLSHTRKGTPNLRAQRVEWEHIAPAHVLGQHLPCWRRGGRKACQKDDQFRALESDLYNLAPAVGEINGDRSNFLFAQGRPALLEQQYGPCEMAVDFKGRAAYPPEAIKGEIARAWLYMSERYHIRMGSSYARLMRAWHRQHPVSDWERTRARRIEALQGQRNRFVWGEGPPLPRP